MTVFEPRISGVGGDRSANWATSTAQNCSLSYSGKSLIQQDFRKISSKDCA